MRKRKYRCDDFLRSPKPRACNDATDTWKRSGKKTDRGTPVGPSNSCYYGPSCRRRTAKSRRGGRPAVPRSTSTSILRRVRSARGARIRGTTSLDARRHAEHPPAACFCASSSSRPRRGGARARTNQGQLDVLKVRCFPDARCCPRRRAHAEKGRNDATTRVRCGAMGAARHSSAREASCTWICAAAIEVLTEPLRRALGELGTIDSKMK